MWVKEISGEEGRLKKARIFLDLPMGNGGSIVIEKTLSESGLRDVTKLFNYDLVRNFKIEPTGVSFESSVRIGISQFSSRACVQEYSPFFVLRNLVMKKAKLLVTRKVKAKDVTDFFAEKDKDLCDITTFIPFRNLKFNFRTGTVALVDSVSGQKFSILSLGSNAIKFSKLAFQCEGIKNSYLDFVNSYSKSGKKVMVRGKEENTFILDLNQMKNTNSILSPEEIQLVVSSYLQGINFYSAMEDGLKNKPLSMADTQKFDVGCFSVQLSNMLPTLNKVYNKCIEGQSALSIDQVVYRRDILILSLLYYLDNMRFYFLVPPFSLKGFICDVDIKEVCE